MRLVQWKWLLLTSVAVCGDLSAKGQEKPLLLEHGSYKIHLLLHGIGTEEYTVERGGSATPAAGDLLLRTESSLNDRGMKRESTTTLSMTAGYSPVRLTQETTPAATGGRSTVEVSGGAASVHEGEASRTIAHVGVAFAGFSAMPAALEMMMMRYWAEHGRPARLPLLRADERALPLEIRAVGNDSFLVKGRMVRLRRYTVANLVFGREVVWMNESGRLAAVMTFAGGLPLEEILDEYEPVAGELVHSGVRQEMLDLADLDRTVRPKAQGTYAIVGARVVDGTGAAAIEDAIVLVRGGRIAAIGKVRVPAGMRVIHAEGKTLLPGLWEMHVHYSGIEFGPALLAAGVTTARDCGGELEFLTSVRRRIDKDHSLGPRLLLAGLIDSGGPLAFGNVDVETPLEAVRAVDQYADLGFQQIKVYTQLTAELLKVSAAEAHRRGMTVTGHVPAAVTTEEGIADGMDQINHLQYVTRAMREEPTHHDGAVMIGPQDRFRDGPLDVGSSRAKAVVALLKARGIVVDPTDGWGEMAGHPRDRDVASFEPGVNAAPYMLAARFRGMGVPAAEVAAFDERMKTNLQVIRALYQAGVPIVAGSDTGLVGYGLDRELELYVKAGMTPMAALGTATLNAAKAMHMEKDSGTIEVGKRADLVLVEGNPLEHISDIRRVVSVVMEGRMYDSKELGRSVGFSR